MAVSAVATGGGGVVLEHRYGATLLSHLLTGDPVPALGDDVTPLRIHFQTTEFSPVDDLTVVGRAPDGEERVLSVGVRRTPKLTVSSGPTTALIATYLRAVREQWAEIEAGRLRLGLAAASGVRQLAELANIARTSHDHAAFRSRVSTPRRFSRTLRSKLDSFDRLVGDHDLSWRLLVALWPIDLRLEATDQANRSAAVGRLRTVTRERTVGAASALFGRLAELAGDYAPAGASVDEVVLRRDLAGWPLRKPDSVPRAWSLLDRLAVLVRDRTPAGLLTCDGELEIDRSTARADLRAAMHSAVADHRPLVITGEPDVGKSALALRAVEELPQGVVALSLRDLPATMFEFEAELGSAFTEVLGDIRTPAGSLLVVDGAEAVLEGRRSLLIDVLVSAVRAGAGVAAVTRTDGAAAVADCALAAQRAVGVATTPLEHVVPGLDDAEAAELVGTFTGLHHLANDRRSAWVLRRPGLIDLLLRSHPVQVRPDEAVSEADVFALIWHGLVRSPDKSPPDGREQALLALARTLLTGARSALDPAALASLRSDGLLLGISPLSAWSRGEEFASDLVRDMAVARLLLVDGWSVLADAGAPRWALRAAKLACQASLDGADQAEVRAAFETLADGHGRRWAELPLEALLTSSRAATEIELAWPTLSAEQRGVLLRLGQDRYTAGGVGDPVLLAPLVDHFYRRGGDRSEPVRATVMAWLKGVLADGSIPLRVAVRAVALADHDVELVALLGADLNADAAAFLRQAPTASLTAVLTSPDVPGSMAVNCPDLLFALCEAVYAEPEPIEWRQPCPSRCEPFHSLMAADPPQALRLINALLERDVVRYLDFHRRKGEHVLLEFPDGRRENCVGKALEWRWYRDAATEVPHLRRSCALSAVERHSEHMIAAGVTVEEVASLLLRDCTNAPMAGLAVGLLLRHRGTLDTWLPQPAVWSMEHSRANIEHHLRDIADLQELWKAVARLVIAAAWHLDEQRLDTFAVLADELTRRAEELNDHDTVRACAWGAAAMRADNYALKRSDDGIVTAELNLPADALPELEEFDEESELSRIKFSLMGFGVPGDKSDYLLSTLRGLRHATMTARAEGAIEATAVSVIAMYSEGLLSFADDDLLWCANRLIDITAKRLRTDQTMQRGLHLFNWAALATLLSPRFDDVAFDRAELEHCLVASVTSPLVFVEYHLDALSRVWSSPCQDAPRCRHETAWAVLTAVVASAYRVTAYALIQVAAAAHHTSCVTPAARAAFDEVLEQYHAGIGSTHGFGMGPSDEELVVSGMFFSLAARGDLTALTRHLDVLRELSFGVDRLLLGMAQHATTCAEARQALPLVWPAIMREVLRHPGAPASLLPVPDAGDDQPDLHFDVRAPRSSHAETLAEAQAGWFDPRPHLDLIEEWANRVRDAPGAADALVGLARTTSIQWQATIALPLVERVIGDAHAQVATRSKLVPGWLADVHASSQLTPATTEILHRIVDALVAEGDKRLVPLQIALE